MLVVQVYKFFVGSIEAEELIVDIEVGGIDCVNVSDGEGKVKGL